MGDIVLHSYYSYDYSDDHDKNSECATSLVHSPATCPKLKIQGSWGIIKNPNLYNGSALSTNLIVDGDFEQSSLTENWNYAYNADWNYASPMAVRDTTYKKSGSYSVKCGDGVGSGRGIAEKIKHKVTPGEIYNLNFYTYSTNSASRYIICLRLFDKNGTDVTAQKRVWSYSTGYLAQYVSSAVPSGSWVRQSYTIQIPLGVYFIQFAFMSYGTDGDKYIWFDNISFTKVSNADYVEFEFNGSGISVTGVKNYDHGKLYYSIDGGQETEVDCYSPSFRVEPLISVDNLSERQHTLKIRSSSEKNSSSEGYAITLNAFIPQFLNSVDYTGYSEVKPKIYIEPLEKGYWHDLKGKIAGSTVENKNAIRTRVGTTAVSPTDGSWSEISDYSNLSINDDLGIKTSTTTANNYPYQMFVFDMSGIDTDVNIVKNNLTEITYEWRGRAKGQNSGERNSALHYIWNGSSWVSIPASGQEMSGFDFMRGSDAYQLDGTKVTGNVPRFEPGKFYNWLTKNQSDIETDTSGFSALGTGVTISRSTSYCWEGEASLQITCDGSTTNQGFYTSTRDIIAGKTYTAGVYLRGSGTVFIELQELKADGTVIGQTTAGSYTLTNSWQRYTVTREFSNQGFKAIIGVYTSSAQSVTFYADGLSLHEGDTALEWRPGQTGKALYVEYDGTNLFDNSGFETGDLTGWTVDNLGGSGSASITSSQKYSGSYGCLLSGGTNGVILYQTKGTSGLYTSIQFYVKASDLSAIDNTTVKCIANGEETDFDYIEPIYYGWYRCSKEGVTWSSGNWGIKVLPNKIVYIDNALLLQNTFVNKTKALKTYIENSKSIDYFNILAGQFVDFTKPFTIKTYMKHNKGDISNLMFLYDKSGSTSLYFGIRNDLKAIITYWNTSGTMFQAVSSSTYEKGNWYFCKFIYDGTYYKLYINNTLVCSIQPSNHRIPYKIATYSSNVQFAFHSLQILNKADESIEDLTKPPVIDSNTVFYVDLDGTLDFYSPFKATLTSSLSQYVQSDNKIYVLVRPQSPADGTNTSEIETDYVRLKVKHKYAKNITIIRRNRNLLDNPLPTGAHMQPIPEWNYGTGLSNAYDNVYDAKEEAILVRNYSSSHRGKGQKLILTPGKTYTLSFDLKSPVPIFVSLWYYKPDFSAPWGFGGGIYSQYYIYDVSATEYRRYSLQIVPKYSHLLLALRIAGSSTANTYWKNFTLVESTEDIYSDSQDEYLVIDNNISGTDLIEAHPDMSVVLKNSENINSTVNTIYFLNPISLRWEKNTFKTKCQGAIRITLRR